MTQVPTRIRVRARNPQGERALEGAGVHPLLARLLAARGCQAPPAERASELLPPTTLLDIDVAAKRIADAIEREERIVIVADYDCDGATAGALGVRGLRALGAQVDYLVPNRFTTGYGLTPAVVDLARALEPRLLVTVDNGIASIDGVAHARAAGIDVVITDHHLPGAQLPMALAIVNPNQPGCRFPSKDLAGVGVMFYVLMATRAELRERGRYAQAPQPRLDTLLDLVALGTVADLVRLDANNRLLVQLGLDRIRNGQTSPGILALARVAGREARTLTTGDLGYALAPRINAAGRLADMRIGIECLLTDDATRAFFLAEQLDRINAERRNVQDDMNERAAALVLDRYDPAHQRSIVAFDPGFHAGVTGLVASRLREAHHRPAIVFAPTTEGMLSGSGRSIPGFHLRDAIDLVTKRAPALVQRFGGHAMAAGLTIRAEDLPEFERHFEAVATALIGADALERVLDVDGPLEVGYIQPQIAQLLDAQIWGQAFAPPVFYDTWDVVNQRVMRDKHVRATLEKDGRRVEAWAFNYAEPLPARAALAFRLALNEYNGAITARLVIERVLDA